LQMVVKGDAMPTSVASEARRALAAFSWGEPNIDPSLELTDT
jgi:hypothetical protein